MAAARAAGSPGREGHLRRHASVALTLLSLGLMAIYWVGTQTTPRSEPWERRPLVFVHGHGPLAWFTWGRTSAAWTVGVFLVLWGAWAFVIETTPVGRLHPLLHLLLALLWMASACPVTGLAVT